VTLTGYVPSYTEKRKAERVAKRVRGIKAVANDIEVQMPSTSHRTDAEIARAAFDALKWAITVPDDRLKISVSKGWVYLEGDVDWQYQRTAAEDAVHSLVGVQGVTNQIAVKPQASATEVKSRIEAAFRRSAELDAQQVRVELQDGKVTLHGQLHSWAERDEADRTAWAAPGVSEVENLIMVTPVSGTQEEPGNRHGRSRDVSVTATHQGVATGSAGELVQDVPTAVGPAR
jgi:osmotically-inducible protein OsmY